MEPSSFCSLSTFTCHHELFGLMLSLSVHHPGAKFYGMVDTKTQEAILSYTPTLNLEIHWFVELDKYTGKNRSQMTTLNIWTEFQMKKALVIKKTLEKEVDTLFLDADILVIDKINNLDKTKDIGISPHYIKKRDTDKFGYYNGGVLWTNNKNIPDRWIEYSKTSRFYDQASIEDLAKEFAFFEFGENYNFSWWRVHQSDVSAQHIQSNLTINDSKIYYKDQPLKFVHTHFTDNGGVVGSFNTLIKNLLTKIKDYRSLMIINRIAESNWVISYPKQPMGGIWGHSNDSYRQLLVLIRCYNKDVILNVSQVKNVWLEPNILLFDRPTLSWFNDKCKCAHKVLLGNGSMLEEGKLLNKLKLDVSPWIFWPRRPILYEKILKNTTRSAYSDRIYKSVFIGNYENSVQKRHRTVVDWSKHIQEFYLTSGAKKLFTPEEYLMKLSQSKFGLCLRGFGSKCHREVELMGLGCVPIITPGVSIEDYYDPPLEHVHYIKVSTPDELESKIASISPEKWQEMSNSCTTWYMRNIHSSNTWNTTLTLLLTKTPN